jgi:fructose-1,6-bisphosphatase/inositol monophosphatase family enzyme
MRLATREPRAMRSQAVARLLREVAAVAIMPRFRRLASGDIRDKSPGEEVTVADVEAEHLLTTGLRNILPGSAVVGEEAVARTPDLLREVGRETAWLVDPLDGTANFVAGSTCFSMMVCLLRRGEAVEAWMLSPATGILHIAQKGGGAWIEGERVRTRDAPALPDAHGAILTRFLPEALCERLAQTSSVLREVRPGLRCAGEEYPAIVRGEQHFALFGRTLPWDHAAGVLFLTEAGGHAADFDGRPYNAVKPNFGLLAASTPPLWSELRRHLLDGNVET